MTEREIFSAAVTLTDRARREAFLTEACAGQDQLQRRIEALLQAHDAASAFLATPAIIQALGTTRDDLSGTPPRHANPADITTRDNSEILEDPSVDRTLSYLAPTEKPGSLGRLGHYEIEAVLGRGGFGTVLRAFDERLHRTVAIKMLSPELAATSPPRKRFLREARAAAAIRHQNVVQIYAVEDLPIPYFVMECVPGQTLQQLLDAHGPLDVAEVLSIGRHIAAGLAAAHVQGLVHRDIKPANILIEGGPNGIVRISDFGLARTADDASLTQSGTVAGTPLFMSPEQALGRTIDQRSDLFSLGSVLYQMVTGHAPFRAASMVAVLRRVVEEPPRPIAESIPECPDWLTAIIARLLAKSPDDRFASAAEVADLLGRCFDDLRANRPMRLPAGIRPSPTALVVPESDIATHAPPPAGRRRAGASGRRSLLAAGLVCAALALGVAEATGVTQLAATVIRLATGNGTLVIETDDPGIRVTIDGEEIQIRGAGVEQVTLKPGRYQVLASKDGKPVSQQLVTIAKGGREVVRVSLEQEASQTPTTSTGVPDAGDGERRVAEWALSKGAYVRIVIRRPGEYPQYQEPKSALDFPAEAFDCDNITFPFGAKLTESDIARLLDAKKLDRLELMRTNLTDAGLQTISRMESLCVLSISDTRVTDAGLPALRRLPQLRELSLYGLTVTAAGLQTLAGLPLERLEVGATQFSGHDWQVFALFPRLKGMSFQECGGFDDTDLAALTNISALEGLHLGKTGISDAGLTPLGQFRGLSQLFLSGNPQLTDAAVESLAKVSSLRDLHVERTGLTADGIDRLHRHLPECRITWDGGVVERRSALQADRRVAAWALSKGARIRVTVRRVAGPWQYFAPKSPADFPTEDFVCDEILFTNRTELSETEISNLREAWHLVRFELAGSNLSDSELKIISQVGSLTYLNVGRSNITDERLQLLRPLAGLNSLVLFGNPVTTTGLYALRELPLEYLEIGATNVTLDEWNERRLFPGLKQLSFQETPRVSDEDFAGLGHWQRLETLSLQKTDISDAGLKHLAQLPRLCTLYLGGCTKITDAGFDSLSRMSTLQVLVVDGTRLSADTIDRLHAALPECRITWDGGVIEPSGATDRRAAEWVLSIGGSIRIRRGAAEIDLAPGQSLPTEVFELTHVNLQGNPQATDSGLSCFLGCTNLRSLRLLDLDITDEGLAAFQHCKQLEFLELEGTRAVGAGLAHFRDCPNLVHLGLGFTNVSDADLGALQSSSKLSILGLRHTKITNAGLVHLKHWRDLTDLSVEATRVSDEALRHIARCEKLTGLSLCATNIGDSHLVLLHECKALARLNLNATKTSKAGVEQLSASLPDCQINWEGGVIGPVTSHDRSAAE